MPSQTSPTSLAQLSSTHTHPIAPIFSKNSRILILGTFPSVKSREENFYYAHKLNRFWKVLATVYNFPIPQTVEEKSSLLLKNDIALWDVIQSCTIAGSSDSSIRDVVPNDLSKILKAAKIQKIFCNGNLSLELYKKYLFPVYKMPAVKLPSTSPANAAWTLAKLCDKWKVIKDIE